MLLSVCFVLFIILKSINLMIYLALTQKNVTLFVTEYVKDSNVTTIEELNSFYGQFSTSFIAKLITLIFQGVVIFFISFLIIRKKKYEKKYWVPSLLIILMIHNTGNPNFYYAQNFVTYSLYIIFAMLIGIFSIYLSTKVRTEKR